MYWTGWEQTNTTRYLPFFIFEGLQKRAGNRFPGEILAVRLLALLAELLPQPIFRQDTDECSGQRLPVVLWRQNQACLGNRRSGLFSSVSHHRKAASDGSNGTATAAGDTATNEQKHIGTRQRACHLLLGKQAEDLNINARIGERSAQRWLGFCRIAPQNDQTQLSYSALCLSERKGNIRHFPRDPCAPGHPINRHGSRRLPRSSVGSDYSAGPRQVCPNRNECSICGIPW